MFPGYPAGFARNLLHSQGRRVHCGARKVSQAVVLLLSFFCLTHIHHSEARCTNRLLRLPANTPSRKSITQIDLNYVNKINIRFGTSRCFFYSFACYISFALFPMLIPSVDSTPFIVKGFGLKLQQNAFCVCVCVLVYFFML